MTRLSATNDVTLTIDVMSETSGRQQPTTTARCSFHDVLEHAMRCSSDDRAVLALLGTEPGSHAYLAALGRLLSINPGPLAAGTPLLVWGGSGLLDPNWRNHCPPIRQSVWGELQLLRSLHHHPDDIDETGRQDPLAELEHLRAATNPG